jgi:hypothetical protein
MSVEEPQNLLFSLDIVTNKNQGGQMGVAHSMHGIKENYIRRLQNLCVAET